MEQINLKHLINQYPDALTDGTKLETYLLDLYPGCKRGIVNILVAIQRSGIVAEMQAKREPSVSDMSRWKKVLDDDYGFAGETVETCLQMWRIAVGTRASATQKVNTVRPQIKHGYSESKHAAIPGEECSPLKADRTDKITVEVGDTFSFGTYEQDNNPSNGREAIEWLVLAKDVNKILLVSEKALDCQKYNNLWTHVTWENCSLRKWLNSTFLSAAFSAGEQKHIINSSVPVDINPKSVLDPGNATMDRVFLLSMAEAEQYFGSDEERKCIPTDYAVANNAYTSNKYTKDGAATCWWWLRTLGNSWDEAACIYSSGSVGSQGYGVDGDHGCVRPAMWVDLDSYLSLNRRSDIPQAHSQCQNFDEKSACLP